MAGTNALSVGPEEPVPVPTSDTSFFFGRFYSIRGPLRAVTIQAIGDRSPTSPAQTCDLARLAGRARSRPSGRGYRLSFEEGGAGRSRRGGGLPLPREFRRTAKRKRAGTSDSTTGRPFAIPESAPPGTKAGSNNKLASEERRGAACPSRLASWKRAASHCLSQSIVGIGGHQSFVVRFYSTQPPDGHCTTIRSDSQIGWTAIQRY